MADKDIWRPNVEVLEAIARSLGNVTEDDVKERQGALVEKFEQALDDLVAGGPGRPKPKDNRPPPPTMI
jgi:hypothetical protein